APAKAVSTSSCISSTQRTGKAPRADQGVRGGGRVVVDVEGEAGGGVSADRQTAVRGRPTVASSGMAEIITVGSWEIGTEHYDAEGMKHDLRVRLTGRLPGGVRAVKLLEGDHWPHWSRWPLTDGPNVRNQLGDVLTLGRVLDVSRQEALDALDEALRALQSE
ncbi:MAG TPA: hypothetical protein VES93_13965, partial [Ornithinibacter sp.]|nr:hypothetical protein [Ornithinibacter sp.]